MGTPDKIGAARLRSRAGGWLGGRLVKCDFRSQSGSHQSSASSQNPKWSRVSVAKILVQNILDPINVFGLKYLTWPLDTVQTCAKKPPEIL